MVFGVSLTFLVLYTSIIFLDAFNTIAFTYQKKKKKS